MDIGYPHELHKAFVYPLWKFTKGIWGNTDDIAAKAF